MRINRLMLFMLLLGYCHIGCGQEQVLVDTLNVQVYFRQGYSILEFDYRDNAKRLAAFVDSVRTLQGSASCRVKTFRIVGTASPEGVSVLNKRLSENRAKNLVAWIEEYISLEGATLDIQALGIDWERLERQVVASDMPYREEVLDILRNTPEWIIKDGVVVDGRKRRLGMLHGGRAWWYLYEHFFPELRSSDVHVICKVERLPVPVAAPRDSVIVEHRDTVIPVMESAPIVLRDTVRSCDSSLSAGRPFYMSLKTNLLYDVALVPNIGAEFYVGRGWSIGGNWMYAWWKSDKRHNYWRMYGGELDIRKYFGRRASEKPLTGHHLGLYGQIFTYDFETGGRGYMGGKPGGTLWDRMNYAVGLEYGYSLPVGRRLNLDFTVGVGYWGGEYQKYLPEDGHYVWTETRQRHWFGPTKAEISLVWLLGRGNYNAKKGGKR
ncbi:DUF3575 domain-containing protein [Alistipes putredinis]|uniref:DUF3575 domain-containing protein n=1 Tax=Alistipes putredinis TaxID=28117 RepID=UPI003D15ABAD